MSGGVGRSPVTSTVVAVRHWALTENYMERICDITNHVVIYMCSNGIPSKEIHRSYVKFKILQ
jgi:hypothetical protein